MTLFRFLRANRQAQLVWINQNTGKYLAFNAVLAVVLVGPMLLESYRTERAMQAYYRFKKSETTED